jgi:hypothetical protein
MHMHVNEPRYDPLALQIHELRIHRNLAVSRPKHACDPLALDNDHGVDNLPLCSDVYECSAA